MKIVIAAVTLFVLILLLVMKRGYYGVMELEEKRKEAQQWLDKVKTLAKEQNYNIRNFPQQSTIKKM